VRFSGRVGVDIVTSFVLKQKFRFICFIFPAKKSALNYARIPFNYKLDMERSKDEDSYTSDDDHNFLDLMSADVYNSYNNDVEPSYSPSMSPSSAIGVSSCVLPMPPPPQSSNERMGVMSNARTDQIYSLQCELNDARSKRRQNQHLCRDGKSKRPRRLHIPPSRTIKFAKTVQVGGGCLISTTVTPTNKKAETIEDAREEEDLRVFSKLPMKMLNDARSRHNRGIDIMQRSTGTMRRVPEFLNQSGCAYPDKWKHNCWWCMHTFKTSPVGCPTRYDKRTDTYYMMGMYCSYNCCKAWARVNKPAHQMGFIGAYICKMVREQCRARGEKLSMSKYKCEAAPMYTTLRAFGGYMSIEEFRNQHCSSIRLECYPQNMNIVPIGYNIFEMPRDSSKLYAAVRPSKYRKTLSDVQTQATPINKKRARTAKAIKTGQKCKKAKGNAEKGVVKQRTLQQILWDSKNKSKKSKHKMYRRPKKSTNSVRNIMGIK
jgi:hypothetical protein